MERGPMALFSAIVAVGLGPAMWLGAQVGQARVITVPPTIAVVERNADTEPGGRGAADTGPDRLLSGDISDDTRPRVTTSTRTVRNVRSSPSPSAVSSPTPSPEPTGMPVERTDEPSPQPSASTAPPDGSPAPEDTPGTPPEPSASTGSSPDSVAPVVLLLGGGAS